MKTKMRIMALLTGIMLAASVMLTNASTAGAGTIYKETLELEFEQGRETEQEETPAIPHTLEGRSDCLSCHGPAGIEPFPANHAGRTNDICTTCHQQSSSQEED